MKVPRLYSKRSIGLGLFVVVLGLLTFGWMTTRPVSATHIKLADAVFQIKCTYTHTAPDDPLVFPGIPGAAHSHDFFGAKGINAFSTTQSMLSSPTSCSDAGDRAGYWSPSIIKNGVKYHPEVIDAYYTVAGKHPPMVAYPLGLRMIAGDPTG